MRGANAQEPRSARRTAVWPNMRESSRRRDRHSGMVSNAVTTGQLDSRRILITGAAGGQGAAVARKFAAEGASLALSDLPSPELEALGDEIRRAGASATCVPADVCAEDQVAATVQGACDYLGGLDVLYNNAGVYWPTRDAPIDRLDREVFDEVMMINTTGVFLFAKHAIPHLLKSRDGVLINVASVAAYAGDTECHAYAASKGALIALTRSIAQSYGPAGLRANVICPGFIATPMVDWLLDDRAATDRVVNATALRRVGEPEEVAAVATFLASTASSFVTGTEIDVHGGLVK
jgi:NAD(P)-dependent dehydrogenase (short-subunit alcohol dehydrogenase family)